MIENEMRPAIVNWLNRNGYYDAHECCVQAVGYYCDVIGCLWADRFGRRKPELLELVCVELKMRDIKGVIRQAEGNHYQCNMSFCAMPAAFILKMRPQSRQQFIDAGVGLIAVGGNQAWVEIQSTYRNVPPHIVLRERLWNFKLRSDRRKKYADLH